MSYKTGVQVLVPQENIVPGKNAKWDGVDQDTVEGIAKSYEEEGQLQACLIRPLAGDKVELIVGFTRYAAMLLYNERHPDNPMRLKCVQVSCNVEEALRKNITENRLRKTTTPMDDAFAQRRLREEHGWPDVKIAEFYRMSPSRVSQLKRLLSLDRPIQEKVHTRELSFKAAMELAGVPDATALLSEVEEIEPKYVPDPNDPEPNGVQGEWTETGFGVKGESNGTATATRPVRTKSQRIVDKARDAKIDKGGAVARTLGGVKKDLTGWLETLEGEQKDFVKAFLKYLNGGLKTETMLTKVKEFVK